MIRFEPDGPTRPASVGIGLTRWLALRQDYLGTIARLRRDGGDVVHSRIAGEHYWDLLSPSSVREALVEHADVLTRWERAVDVFSQLFGEAVLTTEGAAWKRHRQALRPALKSSAVERHAALIRDVADAELDEALPAGLTDAVVDVDRLLSRTTLNVILRLLFGEGASPGEADEALRAARTLGAIAFREMFWPTTLPDWLPLPGKAAKREALATLRVLIGARLDGGRPGYGGPLLGRASRGHERDEADALDGCERFDLGMTLLQAGHETTAAALTWWVYLLARHPAFLHTVVDEIDRELGGARPTAKNVGSLRLLSASLKEAMRLYPPIAVLMSRRTVAPLRLGDRLVPAGSILRFSVWELHRDPESHDEPERFRPERFLPGRSAPPRGAYVPFGVGPRICVGQHLALLQMRLVGATFLQKFRLGTNPHPPICEPEMQIVLRPKQALTLRLIRRP